MHVTRYKRKGIKRFGLMQTPRGLLKSKLFLEKWQLRVRKRLSIKENITF